MTAYAIGSIHSGFMLERSEEIAEIRSKAYLFTHTVLGCQALAIKNSDPNKTFCVSFRTVPSDSTGVAHILEHAVLMGSRKYPVKDVFGEINKGGLMTFLNAMTGADTTLYPFATRNLQEYFHIMDVYCDVVFHPLLLRSTFEQEGWHYHLEHEDESIQYMGVVFNEMKGAFSDPIRTLFHHTYAALMPGSTYAHESGGDPRCIPDLSYEQFVAFHQTHYHPANSTFFFYGDAPLEQELAFLQNNFLSHYEMLVPRAVVMEGTMATEPILVEENYPVQPGSPLDQKTFMALSSIIGPIHDRKQTASFQVIANILFNSDASPLKKAVINANLCKDFGGLFLSNHTCRTLMITYLIGTDPDKRAHFQNLYRATLSRMVDNGLDRDLVLSELNKYEFSVREDLNKAQRGLDLIGKAQPAMQHGLAPFEALRVDNLLAEIRREALDNRYFEQLIRSRLLDNPATAMVVLAPDPHKGELLQREEQDRLRAHAQTLDASSRRELVDRTLALIALQSSRTSDEDLRKLPRLSRGDLDPRPPFHTVQASSLAGALCLINDLDTNGICYIDIGLDCTALPLELLPYLDLFGTIITEIGTERLDYMRFAKAINLCTGGFSHSFQVYLQAGNKENVRPVLWLHVKVLSNFLDQAIALINEVLQMVDFSNYHRIEEIIQREYAWAEHSALSEGYTLASTSAFAHLSRAGQYNEHVHGIHAYSHLRHLATNYLDGEDRLHEALSQIRDLLFRRQGLLFSITAEQSDISRFQLLGADTVMALPERPILPVHPAAFSPGVRRQAFITPAEVVYNVQACTLFPEPSHYRGQFEVLRTWLSRDYLWNTVRQQNGAYGCFIQFNHLTGNFGMVSYRDPQVAKTYDAFEALPAIIEQSDFFPELLDQLIIGAYNSYTPHLGPAAKGATARNDYLSGVTPVFRQERLNEMLTATAADLKAFAPYFQRLKENSCRTTLGNGSKIEQDKEMFDRIVEL